MLILAIDTCLNQCAVCLYDARSGAVVAEKSEVMERGHAEALAPMVQVVLAGATPDRIAVTTGPGTFTGVRIGLSFARAFGLALKIPVIGLDTLKSLRLARPEQKILALTSGQSGLAFVDVLGSTEISLQSLSDIAPENFITDNVCLQRLAAWSATQKPGLMPEPVYIRQADAKPPATIKQVNVDQANVLAQMHKQCFETAWSEQEFNNLFSIPGTSAFIAEVANEPAAFSVFRMVMDETEVITIATLPERRSLGLAGKILGHFIQSHQPQVTFLEVASDNLAAQRLYAKNGFVEIARRKTYYTSGADAIVMQLKKQ